MVNFIRLLRDHLEITENIQEILCSLADVLRIAPKDEAFDKW